MKESFRLDLKTFKFLSIFILSLCTLSHLAQAQALNLDADFDARVSDAPATVFVSATQADGKVLVGGAFQLVNGEPRSNLVRLNSDGTIDTTFNAGGSGADSSVYEIIILADGKLLVGGGFTSYNGNTKSGLIKLNADGSLDNTFNSGGTGVTGTVQTISLQNNGKILISGGGISAYNGTSRISIARINADGSIDPSFTSGLTNGAFVEEIDAQTDGKILIGGTFSNYGGTAVSGIVRLNADGTLDNSFNVNYGTRRSIAAMTLQSDGKVLIGGGYVDNQGTEKLLLARLNVNGSTDTSFIPPAFTEGMVEYFSIQSDCKPPEIDASLDYSFRAEFL